MGFLETLRTIVTLGKGVTTGIRDVAEDADPFDLFGDWYTAARKSGVYLPEAMSLATATLKGRPSSRMVLLKDFGPEGFLFYTNYESRKAEQLDANPRAALLFHWSVLQRQVRVEGSVERLPRETSRTYFQSRPRESQIGAWASRQSSSLESRARLEDRYRQMEERFEGKTVPLPDFWGGYRVRPETIEFWQGRLYRLHDRIVYYRSGDEWETRRLYP